MKYISHTLLLSLATLLLALAACQNGNDFGEGYTPCIDCPTPPEPSKPYIYVDSKERTEIEFQQTGGTETVLLSSNVGWEVKSQPDWISKIDPNNGTGSNSTVTVRITADANTTEVKRTGDIVFVTTDGSHTATVTCKQLGGKPEPDEYSLTISPSELSFDSDGKATDMNKFTVESKNVEWKDTCDSGWCHTVVSSDKTSITVTVDPYTGKKQREAKIKVEPTDTSLPDSLKKTVTVIQHGVGPYTNVTSEKVIELENPDQTTKDIEVVSNEQWTATFSEETYANASSWGWSISQTTPNGNGKATITISNNTTEDEHKATVIIKGTESEEIPVTITQPGINLMVSSPSIFSASGGSQVLTVDCNIDDWTSTSSDGSVCTVERDNKTLIVTCSENTTTKQRTAKVTVTARKVTKTVYVTQEPNTPTPYTNVASPTDLEINFGLATGTKEIVVDSNEEWEAQLTGDDTSWIESISPQNDSNSKTVKVTAKANDTETPHTATITIIGITSGDSTPISLTQDAIKLMVDTPEPFNSEGDETQTLKVTCNTTWKASQSDKSWCVVSPTTTQTGGGSITVSVTEKNDATTSRTAKFTVTAGKVEKTITVTQKANGPYIYISGNDIYTDGNGKKCMTLGNGKGTKPISVSTNDGPFKVSSNADWCKVPDGEVSGNTFNLVVEANDKLSKRTATITVTSKSGKATDTLTVTQKAGNIGVEEYE